MIKFFNDNYQGRFNWVDDENNFVGYSNGQNCCENFGFCYFQDLNSLGLKNFKELELLEGDIFYKNVNRFLYKIDNKDTMDYKFSNYIHNELDSDNNYKLGNYFYRTFEDCCTVFSIFIVELFIDKKIKGYLMLYNCHNGYYYHFAEYKHNEFKKRTKGFSL